MVILLISQANKRCSKGTEETAREQKSKNTAPDSFRTYLILRGGFFLFMFDTLLTTMNR